MKLSVVIVSYNVRRFVEQCLDSVQKASEGIDTEVFVVDNDSADDTVEVIGSRYPWVHLIANGENLGFARANNIAIRQAQGEYVLLLNPDTVVAEPTLREAVNFMDAHPQAGGIGVRMHNADGTLAPESRRAIPTPWVSFCKMLGFSRRYYMSHLSWDEPGRIEVISGAFCLLRRNALDQIGLLDEDFFMYGEDIDLSFRLLKGGWENWYIPADIVHFKGESTQKSTFRYVHVFYQAMLIFFRKHYSHLSVFYTVPIKMAIYFRATIALTDIVRKKLHL
ncbi:MAG: glycosyltransferase family 2 protein [Prevotella sp.]|nr:glycosyltransferase family 2 protein [Prevotella sp.]